LKTSSLAHFWYPYEEFAEQIRAMRIVRTWEYTARFGHVGSAQTSRANNARVIDYFVDSYADEAEAVQKAELFLSIHDYVGRNAAWFAKQGLVEELNDKQLSVDPALLRAVHYVFTATTRPAAADPKQIAELAKAFRAIEL
jgi:hypothetical protein